MVRQDPIYQNLSNIVIFWMVGPYRAVGSKGTVWFVWKTKSFCLWMHLSSEGNSPFVMIEHSNNMMLCLMKVPLYRLQQSNTIFNSECTLKVTSMDICFTSCKPDFLRHVSLTWHVMCDNMCNECNIFHAWHRDLVTPWLMTHEVNELGWIVTKSDDSVIQGGENPP